MPVLDDKHLETSVFPCVMGIATLDMLPRQTCCIHQNDKQSKGLLFHGAAFHGAFAYISHPFFSSQHKHFLPPLNFYRLSASPSRLCSSDFCSQKKPCAFSIAVLATITNLGAQDSAYLLATVLLVRSPGSAHLRSLLRDPQGEIEVLTTVSSSEDSNRETFSCRLPQVVGRIHILVLYG